MTAVGWHTIETRPRGRPWRALVGRMIDRLLGSVTSEQVASRLEVSVHTVAAWRKPSRDVVIPADRLLEVVCREDVVGAPARRAFLEELCRQAGFVAVAACEADADEAPLGVQALEVCDAVGKLAGTTRAALGDGELDAAEAARLLKALAEVERETAQLRATIEGGA